MERIQKYLSRAGIASRREAEKMVLEGRVKVNEIIIREMGHQIDPNRDRIKLDDKLISIYEKKIYIMLNKPKGVITSMADPQGRKKVVDLLCGVKERVYPVGRLDYATEGLLLLTNDGDLAYHMTHPKFKVEKIYQAKVEGRITSEALNVLRNGVLLEDGMTLPAKVRKIGNKEDNCIEIVIREGKKRQVRRMFAKIGCPVIELKRIGLGPLKLGRLASGKHRELTKKELADLKLECMGRNSCK